MYGFLIVLHVLISIALILVVLMQSGKGGGMSAAFGGGGGSPVQPQTLPTPAGDLGLPGVDEGVAPPEGGAELPGTEAEGMQIPLTEPVEDAGTGTETPGTTEPESPDEGGGAP
jgi:hypothetical protein